MGIKAKLYVTTILAIIPPTLMLIVTLIALTNFGDSESAKSVAEELGRETKVVYLVAFLILLSDVIVFINREIFRSIEKPISDIVDVLSAVRAGDMKRRSSFSKKSDLGEVCNDLNLMLDTLESNNKKILTDKQRYALATKDGYVVIWEIDFEEGSSYISENISDFFGEDCDIKTPFDLRKYVDDRDIQIFDSIINGIGERSRIENIRFNIGGKDKIFNISGTTYLSEGNERVTKTHGRIIDFTQQALSKKMLEKYAFCDELTELNNRLGFKREVGAIIAAKPKEPKSIILINVNRFHRIIESIGYENSNLLLKDIAALLWDRYPLSTPVGRVDSHIFGVFLQCPIQEAVLEAGQLMNAIIKPWEFGGCTVIPDYSIGAAEYPFCADAEELIVNATTTIKMTKGVSNSIATYDGPLQEYMRKKLAIEECIKNCYTNNSFYIVYQPQYDTFSEKIVGFEALCRMNDAKMGRISPSEFVCIAENSGLITLLGEYVMREAMRSMVKFEQNGVDFKRMAINVSPIQLANKNFVKNTISIIEETGANPHKIELEITESSLMTSVEEVKSVMADLIEIGVAFAIDDFGTGYSSLSCLSDMPVEIVKIDRSFIIRETEDGKKLLSKIIEISQATNKKVICEGVETEDQFNLIKSLGGDFIQGWYFSKDLSEEDVLNLAKEQKRSATENAEPSIA